MPRIKNMSARFNALTAAKKASTSKATDTVAAVYKVLGNNFEKVGPGQGMEIKVPDGTTPKSFLATIRGKLVSVGRKGQPWEGRVYQTAYDPDTNEVLVQRVEDTTNPLPKMTGGRPKGSKNGVKKGTEAVAGLDAARSHLGGTPDGKVAGAADDKAGQTDITVPTTTTDTANTTGTAESGKPTPAPRKSGNKGNKPANDAAPVRDLTKVS